MKLLLISNSTNPGEPYLSYPQKEIQRFLGEKKAHALFIPFAAVTFSLDEYESKVVERFAEIGHYIMSKLFTPLTIKSITLKNRLVVSPMCQYTAIRLKVLEGTPYIGWSAGSNVACPTLRTTNDMPIVDPNGFECMNLVPFQINPHYLDVNPPGHGGETREQRILEFLEINPDVFVVGLREGTMLKFEDGLLQLIGAQSARIFRKGFAPQELNAGDDLNFLMRELHV